MATRIRAHAAAAAASSSGGDASAATTSQSAAGNKRKRDALQDISEEHAVNGKVIRQKQQQQQQQQQVSASRRPASSQSIPIPMAPARRTSVRRSRRLSEQQPGTAGGRPGLLKVPVSAGSRSDGSGNVAVAARDETREDGSMSCDEDLEGTVVDLSFECIAEDSEGGLLRDSEPRSSRQASAPATRGKKSKSSGKAEDALAPASEHKSSSSSGISSSNSGSSGNTEISRGTANPSRASGGRGRDRSCTTRGRASGGSKRCKESVEQRKVDAHAADGDCGILVGRHAQCAPCVRERRDSSNSEAQANSSNVRGGHSADPQPSLTPKLGRATPGVRDADRMAFQSLPSRAAAATGMTNMCTPLPAGVEDIDAGLGSEGDSHLLNPDYVVEHAAFLRIQEKRNRPGAYIGSRQKDMRPSMRSVLVDWIVEVCDQFKLSSRTLFQVVELIDRSLSAFEVPRGKLQLLGCACVVLAAKYEEIYAPTAEELAHISDNTYTRAEIISMELVVVNALEFRLTCVTPCNFMDRFCRAARSKARERSLVAYLLELLLQDYQGVTLLPSMKAAAALYLARQTLHPRGCPREAWTKQTEYYTGYAARALEPCVRRLHVLHVRAEANSLHAVRDKYKKAQMHRVAEVTCALDDALFFGSENA